MDIEVAHQRMLEEWQKMGRRPQGPPPEGLPEGWDIYRVCFTGFDERLEPMLTAICAAWGVEVVADVADRPDLVFTLGRLNDLGSRIDRELLRRAKKAKVLVVCATALARVEDHFIEVVCSLHFASEMMTWLQTRTSVAEVDAQLRGDRGWALLRRSLEKGDELWEFSSPPETWRGLCGRAGIALVRGGKIVAQILTSMS